jgi:hypothetical protein
MTKIKKVLDEQVAAKEKTILDENTIEYKLDENGVPVLDEDGNKIVVEKFEKMEKGDKKDDEEDDEEDDDDDPKKDKKEKVDVKESLSKIFAKTTISEEVASDLETLFNAAVDEKVKAKVDVIESEAVEQAVEVIKDLEERVDKYISYVAEEWLSENEVAIESGIQLEVSENLISGLKTIFEDSYVVVPESKVDLVKEAEDTIDNLLSSVDEQKEQNEALQTEINSIKSYSIVAEMTGEFTDTQKEKLGTLIESVEYKDDADYKVKVGVIVESYFNKKAESKDSENLDEETEVKPNDDRMAMYLKYRKR